MNKILRYIAIALTIILCLPSPGLAQGFPGFIYDGIPNDSAVISFSDGLPSIQPTAFTVTLDTVHTTLWRSGTTGKGFFNAGITGKPGIMTDTALPYPVNANEWIMIKVDKFNSGFLANPIVGFTHKFQSTRRKDGGIVEYSFDSLSWSNVVGGCYTRTITDSFYTAADTLTNGAPAFSGSSAWKTSRFQLFQGIPLKTAAACNVRFPFWVRFRFVSDSTADSLAGWIIRSIKVEHDLYLGGVGGAQKLPSLDVYPNPSKDGYFYWPSLEAPEKYVLRIMNGIGQLSYEGAYTRKTNLARLPAGIYYYQASNGEKMYGGTLLKE